MRDPYFYTEYSSSETDSVWTSPYVLFIAAVMLMFTLGVAFQRAFGMHLGVIVTHVVVIFGSAWVYRRLYARHHSGEKGQLWMSMKRFGMSPGTLVLNILAAIALGFLANLLGALMVEIVPGLSEMAEAYRRTIEELVMEATLWQQILGIVAIAVAAPLFEEYLFRGTMLAEQYRRSGPVMAVLMNGLLFSLMHANPIALLPLMIVGIYLAHITLKTWSLWPAIIAHAALNTVNGVILPRVVRDMPQPEEMATVTELFVVCFFVSVVTGFLWWAVLRSIEKQSQQTVPA